MRSTTSGETVDVGAPLARLATDGTLLENDEASSSPAAVTAARKAHPAAVADAEKAHPPAVADATKAHVAAAPLPVRIAEASGSSRFLSHALFSCLPPHKPQHAAGYG